MSLLYNQISIDLEETLGLFLFIFISLYHQFLNNFFGEYIIQKVYTKKSYYKYITQ